MLSDLRVRGLGVIEDLTVALGPGMTALTGETGAGKTLVVEALNLVLGGRATTGLVRAGAPEALIEARFTGLALPTVSLPEVARANDDAEADDEADQEAGAEGTAVGELVLTRSISAAGRSKAWINGRMVPLGALAEAGSALVDIHGQHEHQSLTQAPAQRAALDTFGDIDPVPVAAARRRLAGLDRRLADVGGDAPARARAADVLRHQVNEISAAHLADPDEDDRLAETEARLADLAALRESAAEALALVDGTDFGADDGGDAASLLGRAVAALGGRGPLAELEAQLRQLADEAAGVAHELRQVVETWEDDPAQLAAVQERRRMLGELRRKYGPGLADVVAFAEHAAARLVELESAETVAAQLTAERDLVVAELGAAEAELRTRRAEAAPALAGAVAARLADLAMPGARLGVTVADTGAGEPVRVELGANPGEALQPLAKVASGGELARAMLALRLVASGGPPTMVFDEVDAGVGGQAALALGRALREVGAGHQVLVVTHLAQVAAFADDQVALTKVTSAGRTTTDAAPLGSEARVAELSRMLAGQPQSEAARATAKELLALAHS